MAAGGCSPPLNYLSPWSHIHSAEAGILDRSLRKATCDFYFHGTSSFIDWPAAAVDLLYRSQKTVRLPYSCGSSERHNLSEQEKQHTFQRIPVTVTLIT